MEQIALQEYHFCMASTVLSSSTRNKPKLRHAVRQRKFVSEREKEFERIRILGVF